MCRARPRRLDLVDARSALAARRASPRRPLEKRVLSCEEKRASRRQARSSSRCDALWRPPARPRRARGGSRGADASTNSSRSSRHTQNLAQSLLDDTPFASLVHPRRAARKRRRRRSERMRLLRAKSGVTKEEQIRRESVSLSLFLCIERKEEASQARGVVARSARLPARHHEHRRPAAAQLGLLLGAPRRGAHARRIPPKSLSVSKGTPLCLFNRRSARRWRPRRS